jgi:hypothetical protein
VIAWSLIAVLAVVTFRPPRVEAWWAWVAWAVVAIALVVGTIAISTAGLE